MIYLKRSLFRFGLPIVAMACLSPNLKPGAGAVALLFQSDDASQCRLVAKIDTGQTVIRSFQDAQIILRNAAFEMGANAIRIYRFEPNKKAYAEALNCSGAPNSALPQQKTQKQAKKESPNSQKNSKTQQEKPSLKKNAQSSTKNARPQLSGANYPKALLLWKRCSYGQYFARGTCVGKSAMLDWRAALKYCQSIAEGGKVWRLPSPQELQSLLLTPRAGGAMIDGRAFPKTEPSLYWTNKRYEGSRNVAWTVDFKSGSSFAFGVQNKAYVRCVTER